MRCVVQRVNSAKVTVDNEIKGQTGRGIMALVGFCAGDNEKAMAYIAEKLINLRIFEDEDEKMNLSVSDVGGGILIVPNFTLFGDARKGRRPSFIESASPEAAQRMYGDFLAILKREYNKVESGVFQAHMEVELINDGPVTILLDSSKLF